MLKAIIQEAAALASLALFIAMIAIWTQVLGNLWRWPSPLTTERFPGEQRVEVLVDLIRKSAIHTVDFSRLAQIIAASGERAFHLANLSQARTAALVRTRLPTQTGMRSTWMA
jgi:hypothetical protein